MRPRRLPPTYVSSLCIMEHIDPNLRIVLSHRCPALQSIDKSAPLLVRNLQIHPLEVQINDTSYQIGIIRHYQDPNFETPPEIACSNFLGGRCFDMDQYGFQVADIPLDKDPNEISIDGRNFNEHRLGWRRQWEAEQCKEWEVELEKLRKERSRGNTQEIQFLRVMNGWCTQEDIEQRIVALQHQILPFNLRKSQAPPPYTHYIQLTIKTSQKIDRIERFQYSGSVHNAAKYLMFKLFAGRHRSGCVKTRRLEMEFTGLIRLPKSLKIKAREGNLEEEELDLLGDIVEF